MMTCFILHYLGFKFNSPEIFADEEGSLIDSNLLGIIVVQNVALGRF